MPLKVGVKDMQLDSSISTNNRTFEIKQIECLTLIGKLRIGYKLFLFCSLHVSTSQNMYSCPARDRSILLLPKAKE
jgi:hypothetical protein